MRSVISIALIATALAAQTADFGEAYSFAEREPKTQVERTIHKLLPSIAKIHGASGLATITPYATGVIVSEQGHIVTLDQILLQKDRTRVVLFDGSVHDATLIRADEKLGVRILKINPAEVNGKFAGNLLHAQVTTSQSSRADPWPPASPWPTPAQKPLRHAHLSYHFHSPDTRGSRRIARRRSS